MRIALTQMDIVWEDKEQNLRKGEELVQRAVRAGAEMIIFPEMSFTGFSMNVERIGEPVIMEVEHSVEEEYSREAQCSKEAEHSRGKKYTRETDGYQITETVNKMLRLSKKYPLTIVFGYVRKIEEHLYGKTGSNSLMAVRDGRVLTQYDKIHPFAYGGEGEHFICGNRLAACKIRDMSFGFFICYDLRFPEIFQAITTCTQAIVVIANWPKERMEHWEILLQARAIENQSYVIGVNRIGEGGGYTYAPSSMVFDPYGRWVKPEREKLEEGGVLEEQAELLLVTLNPGMAEEYRREFPLKQDRRRELYVKLYGEQEPVDELTAERTEEV